MLRRPLMIPAAILLLAGLAFLPACNKKKSDGGGGGNSGDMAPPGTTPGAPSGVSSGYLLFAHVNAKQILTGPIFTEVKQAVTKANLQADWDKFEADAAKELGGIKPTEIDSVTVCIPEFPGRGEPKFIAIVTASKPIDKASLAGLGPQAKPDSRGFYTIEKAKGMLLHLPSPNTVAILHSDLAAQYLGGYAKDRTGWPMTAELTKAAAGHTLFAVAQLGKLPRELLNAPEAQMAGPLLQAQTVTLTADLKGKELSAVARATFPDGTTAGKAKETVQGFIGLGANFIDQFMKGKEMAEFSAFMPAVKEAHRALTEAKIEVSGNDLIVSGSYKANFDIGKLVTEGVIKVQAAGDRMKAQNNLKQIALGMINYSDTNGGSPPIHAVGVNGLPLKNQTDKPLLSWRVAILPYIEQNNLYKQFHLNEPWDSEHNKQLIGKMPDIFYPVGGVRKPGYTHLQMVVGPNALQPAGMSFPASFTDGTSNTIMVVEAAEPVIWTKPDDVMLQGKELPKDLKKKFGGLFPGGFNVAMWDGSVRFVADKVSERTLGLLFDPRDGQVIPNDW